MPPKAKFTKEEIVETAFQIVERDGLEALTARSLGSALGSSPRPIFTVFESMDEVQNFVIKKAENIYSAMVTEGLKDTPAFRGVGNAYIGFACKYPKLFQLLFMREKNDSPDKYSVLPEIDVNYDVILQSVEDSYGFGRETSKEIYIHLWVYSHGIAVLIATKVCNFSAEQIATMLKEVCIGIISQFKKEGRV